MAQAWDFVDASVLWQGTDRKPPSSEFLRMRVDQVDWGSGSTRTRNMLLNNSIVTIADLVSHSEAQLLRGPNFGKKSLRQVRKVLAEHGIRLGMLRKPSDEYPFAMVEY
jgi:DNA-directed RNA polymerase subunit alpha